MKILSFICLFLLCSLTQAQTKQTKPGKAVADPNTNSLIIYGSEEYIKRVELLVKDLDNEMQFVSETKVIQLVHLEALEVYPLLQSIMNAYKPNPVRSSQLSIDNNNFDKTINGVVLADDRTNKIIMVSDKKTISCMEKIIKDLDKKPIISNNAYITKIKNADTKLVADLINSVSGKR